MALADVPGLGAYIEQTQRNRQQPIAEMEQAGALIGLQQKMQAQQKARAFESEVAALGPNPDEGVLAKIAAKYATPTDVLKTHIASRDRQASIEATKAAREATVAQQASTAQMQHEFRMRGAQTDEQRAAEVARHNLAMEEIQRQLAEIRKAATPTAPAPSMAEIVDPTNAAQMIRIDARVYRGGGVGSPGVIGVAGKEPSAAKREEKEGQGKELLRTELDNLREHYRVLNEARAIPSSDRSGASNALAYVQGSAVGQLGGRVLGTKEQDARNQIQSGRLRIMNAIKNATGMSAQQLNSNVELKTWLDSLTSMTGSYESNVGIIDALEEAFLKGKGGATPAPGAPTPAPKPPRVVDW